jgi:hypothetical protein
MGFTACYHDVEYTGKREYSDKKEDVYTKLNG